MNSIPSITSMGNSLMKNAKSTTKALTDLTGMPSVGGQSYKHKKSSRKTKKPRGYKKTTKIKGQKTRTRTRKTRTRKYKK